MTLVPARVRSNIMVRPAGINNLFPLSRPILQKGGAQKIMVKKFILFGLLFFAIYAINLVYNHNKRIRNKTKIVKIGPLEAKICSNFFIKVSKIGH